MAFRKYISLYIIVLIASKAWSQSDPLQYVNPFIGTTPSNVVTKWGSEGGTYPGAVAPWGAVQLSPETSVTGNRGYDYRDSTIYFFSCARHFSGFPNGSAGHIFVMPVKNSDQFRLNDHARPFLHKDEEAAPGYYRVLFNDDNTLAEATAGDRTGIFRFTFPANVVPKIFIGDAGKLAVTSNREITGTFYNSVFRFNKEFSGKEEVPDGWIFTFPSKSSKETIIELQVGVSTVSAESAVQNLAAETNSFDQLKEAARNKWRKALSVVEVDDSNDSNKTVFYSALYHALLMPWITSDADGKYLGADGKIYQATSGNTYSAFSPWDTFRSLHPLLCLLFPERQQQMVESMMNIYRQKGYLPTESMTGNHAIAIITDSWLKGVKVSDSLLAFNAMKKSIDDGPFIQHDMAIYRQQGYIPFSYPESVTRTVEYAYDDWAMAQFANVVHNDSVYNRFLHTSFNYRNLFNAQEMFFLPRQGNEYKLHPGSFGYKEGDAWIYSYFVPHNPKDLVNLMGGDTSFATRLDSALATHLVFDNETLFHVPYLFNFTPTSFKTQEWVQRIMRTRFSATPGGLPGNDDLGSMSSWLLFSAMGVYPVCPGRPVYAISSPLFKSVRIHLGNGKQWVIRADNPSEQNRYIQSVAINGKPWHRLWLSHETLVQGGEIHFVLDSIPNTSWISYTGLAGVSETLTTPDFHLVDYSLSKNAVLPDEPLWARFTLQNKGTTEGTKKVTLLVNGKPYTQKNCLVPEQGTVTDSIPFRLYPFGKADVQIEGAVASQVEVMRPQTAAPVQPVISNLVVKPLVRKGSKQLVNFNVQNTDGEQHLFNVNIRINDSIVSTKAVTLQPGGIQHITKKVPVKGTGTQIVRVVNKDTLFKVFSENKETALLDIELSESKDSIAADCSGFGNNGRVISNDHEHGKTLKGLHFNKNCYIEIPNSLSLDSMGETITMMLWVYPIGRNKLTDLFTKGDYHVLQVSNNKKLTFFAGGWGRGECSAPLPFNWFNNWHHIAGVCDGNSLRVYIDGELKNTVKLHDRVNLSVSNKFIIGRNEEFPGQRIFDGYADHVKVFAAPLTDDEISEIVNAEAKDKK
jgi:putative alpha-1,2-mannosidase